ncbi:MAG: hypothetical protein J6W18_03105 [Bacteroidaceae bacterium]|nr:hypothetical protein [Bacteroidaceae bacterium]
MKKNLFFSLILAVGVCALNSCEAIEDAIDEAQSTVDDIQNDQDPEFKDNGLTVTLSYKQSGLGYYYEAGFKAQPDSALFDTVCTSFTLKETFAFKTVAKIAYDEMVENNKTADSTDIVVLNYDNDKIITIDMTAQHKDLPKRVVVLELKTNEAAYWKAKNALQGDSIK